MPRKVKTAEEYAREHEEFSVKEADGTRMLVCKYCTMTILLRTGKTASRIAEHLSSKTHLKCKGRQNVEGGARQLSLPETLPGLKRNCSVSLPETSTGFKRKCDEENNVNHEFARALVQSGASLHQTDGPIGKLFCRHAPAATMLPKTTDMYEKYLHEIFLTDLDHIIELLHGGVKVSVTIDETPEMHGEPALAVLFTFCDPKIGWVRRTIMVDFDIVDTCNAVSIAALLQKLLGKFGKDWCDVVCICSKSASCMKNVCDDLSRGIPEFKAFPMQDPCRLMDGVLKAALESSELMKNAVDFVVHSAALFSSANELKRKYFSFCTTYAVKEKLIPAVSFGRWFSVLGAVNAILSMWRPLTEFLLSDGATGKKCDDLREHINSEEKKNTLYCVLRFLQENIVALDDIMKQLESEHTLLLQVYDVIGVTVKLLLERKLGDTFNDFGYVTCALLECLPPGKQNNVEEAFRRFYSTMYDKWHAILYRNIQSATKSFEVPEASLWYAALVLDPCRKGEFSPDFEEYKFMFHRFDDSVALRTQFNAYVSDPVPGKSHLQVPEYWVGKLRQWPELATCVLNILALPVCTGSVEKSFSQIKVFMGRNEKGSMSKESLKKYCMVYYNQFDL
ncbi:uncharacterized protein [Ambystoma mexicanum]|uniref:uncharacterized protein n=1 Tax=Ambystoma mexicanum TaxID=8296 RepID=UPI0037E91B54